MKLSRARLFYPVPQAFRHCTVFGLLIGMASLGGAQSNLPVPEICNLMRQAKTFPVSLSGTSTVTVHHIGSFEPDLSNPVIVAESEEGTYRWYARNADWWMVKNVPDTSPVMGPILDINVIRNYEDQVLSYTDLRSRDGKIFFGTAHLDRKQDQAPLGPMCGRRWNKEDIADILQISTDIHRSTSHAGIEFDGLYKNEPIHLTIAPQYGYLTTSLDLHPKAGRRHGHFGFNILEVKRFDAVWMPRSVDLFNEESQDGRPVWGFTGHIEFADLKRHGAPTRDEVPPIPPGAILGSEDSRLYKVAQDGKLVDYGHQGAVPTAPLAWGDLFVLSGAGLLLGSLSWLVFRKRRSSLSSPSRR